MQNFLDKHWKKIVLGGLAGGALLLLYLCEESDKPAPKPEKPEKRKEPEEEKKMALSSSQNDAVLAQKTAQTVIVDETKGSSRIRDYAKLDLVVPEFPDVSVDELAKKINVIFDDEGLGMETISLIFQHSLEVIKGQYVKLALKSRVERRKVFFEDKKLYTTLVIEFLEDTENLLNKGADDLLEALNLGKDLFENSCVLLMQKGFVQQMMVLQAAIRQKIKEYIKPSKNLTLAEIKPCVKFQLKILNERKNEFEELMNRLKFSQESIQLIPLGMNVILSDLIYEEFGFEEEDQMFAMRDHMAVMRDREFQTLMMGVEQTIQNMLTGMGMMSDMMGTDMMGGFFEG